MLLPFFTALRDARVPVSMKEWLHLMEAMDRDVAGWKKTAGEHHDPVGTGWTKSSSRGGISL